MATILVADDDAASRLLLVTLLMHVGHSVTAVENGVEALDAAYRLQPAVLLTDLSMPALGGVDLIRTLRKDPRTSAVCIVLYTATSPNDALRDFMQIYGVAGIITKPAEPEIILATIASLLKDRS